MHYSFTQLYTVLADVIKKDSKAIGLAVLCVSTGSPGNPDYIENCSAMERMQDCFETKLGYLTIPMGVNITTSQLLLLMNEVKTLTLPNRFCRIIFYFFGHGDEDSIKCADGYISRQAIITSFQSVCSSNTDIFKIFLFDCCRMVNARAKGISYDESASELQRKLVAKNTLVINAADCNCKAYYDITKGCGLMTHFFTEFASTRNESLYDLLVMVRASVITHSSSDISQMLVYEDKLMGTCRLLAESHGSGKVCSLIAICFV